MTDVDVLITAATNIGLVTASQALDIVAKQLADRGDPAAASIADVADKIRGMIVRMEIRK